MWSIPRGYSTTGVRFHCQINVIYVILPLTSGYAGFCDKSIVYIIVISLFIAALIAEDRAVMLCSMLNCLWLTLLLYVYINTCMVEAVVV